MYKPNALMKKLAEETIVDLNIKEKEMDEISEEYDAYHNDDNYETIDLIYYGEPKAQARARASSNLNHFFDPSKSFKQFINEQIRNQLGNSFKPINTEIYFTCRYYKPYPKSTPRKKAVLMELGAIRPTGRPDLDNYEKLMYDALLNLLFTDDSIVVKGNHQKFYSCKPRVEINIKFRKK